METRLIIAYALIVLVALMVMALAIHIMRKRRRHRRMMRGHHPRLGDKPKDRARKADQPEGK